MKVFLSTIAKFLFLLMVISFDAGFLPGLGGNWNLINIAFIVSVFFIFIFRNAIAYPFYFASILLLSYTAGSLFLIPLIAGFTSLFVINFLLERFFTNRSYYVLLAIGIIAWFIYYAVYALLLTLYHYWFPEELITLITVDWMISILFYTPFSLALLSLGYLATTFMSKRFKSYFIISDH